MTKAESLLFLLENRNLINNGQVDTYIEEILTSRQAKKLTRLQKEWFRRTFRQYLLQDHKAVTVTQSSSSDPFWSGDTIKTGDLQRVILDRNVKNLVSDILDLFTLGDDDNIDYYNLTIQDVKDLHDEWATGDRDRRAAIRAEGAARAEGDRARRAAIRAEMDSSMKRPSGGIKIPSKPENIVLKYKSGFKWVRIPSTDCEKEGVSQANCIKFMGASVLSSAFRLFSLRDPKNIPRLSAQFDLDGTLRQAREFQNRDWVDGDYADYMTDLLTKIQSGQIDLRKALEDDETLVNTETKRLNPPRLGDIGQLDQQLRQHVKGSAIRPIIGSIIGTLQGTSKDVYRQTAQNIVDLLRNYPHVAAAIVRQSTKTASRLGLLVFKDGSVMSTMNYFGHSVSKVSIIKYIYGKYPMERLEKLAKVYSQNTKTDKVTSKALAYIYLDRSATGLLTTTDLSSINIDKLTGRSSPSPLNRYRGAIDTDTHFSSIATDLDNLIAFARKVRSSNIKQHISLIRAMDKAKSQVISVR